MMKRWKVKSADPVKSLQLQNELRISPVICRILAARGIGSYEEARRYFRPDPTGLHNPWLMKDMEKAVKRILLAITRQEKILVFGDYDVDGTTAVASMVQFLAEIYDCGQIDFYIPNRYKEGYGISQQGIEYAYENNFTLIISLDCGIKSADLVRYASSLNIDFIVCDHHLPGNDIPPAVAILNPKQTGCTYPYKELCGCGVGFKLITALAETLSIPEEKIMYYADLVATAIAADIVPMTGENRILASLGLKKVNENPSPGIKALIELNGLKKPLTITNVVFIIAPRVNAAGRMDDAKKAVQLFIEKDPVKALELAEILNSDNTDRREADSTITEQALALINQNSHLRNRKSTVLFQPHWHKGVIGIVASRVMEHYYRPTIILTRSGELLTGSARSIPGFNIHDGLEYCRDLLAGFGGHYFAAGMTLVPEKLEDFSNRFEEIVNRMVPEDAFIPELLIDAEVKFKELTPSFHRIISQMEPFGPDNMRPVFISRRVTDKGSRIVKEKHIRFMLEQEGVFFTGIGFDMLTLFPLLEEKKPLDIVFTLEENEYQGNISLQLKIIDLRLSE